MIKTIFTLKKTIYNRLNSDQDLNAVVAEQISYKEFPAEPLYPHITYSIVSDTDYPYNEDNSEGELARSLVEITIHSTETSSEQADLIDGLVTKLLNKQNVAISNEEMICYSCLKRGSNQDWDKEYRVWTTVSTYSVTWAVRPVNSVSVSSKASIVN